MKIKNFIPACCLALGLTLAIPVAAAPVKTNTQVSTNTTTNHWSADKTAYFKDGKKVTGPVLIGETYYFFNSNGTLRTGNTTVFKHGNALYFVRPNGTLLRNSWGTVGGKKYYANEYAKLYVHTAARIGNQGVYCFDGRGAMLANGFRTIKGKKYLLAANGRAYTGARKYNGKQYFFNTDGSMRTGIVLYRNKHRFYVDPKTGAARTGFFKAGGKVYYATSGGRLLTGWRRYKGTRYYFSPKTGALKTGWVRYGKNYFYYTSGGRLKVGFFKVNGKTYYGTRSGRNKGARIKGFQWFKGKRYLFNSRGVMAQGWAKSGGRKYFADSDGILAIGWRKVKNKWYFFENNGVLKTGWHVHNGKFYYMDPKTGAMVTGRKRIGGKTYRFSKNGQYSRGALSGSWLIRVNRAANVVTVYKGGVPVKAFLCSTGLNNATPLGTFRVMDKLYRHELNGPTYGYYCSHITSDILFHSIPAPTTSRAGVPTYKFNMLGSQASEGCIRLMMGDAYWLYQNVPVGSTVQVYDNARNPGPLGRPKSFKMPTSPTYTYDPTDPDRLRSTSAP